MPKLRRRLRSRPYPPWKSEGASAPDRFLECGHLDIRAHGALNFDRRSSRSIEDHGDNDHPWHGRALGESEPQTCG